MADLVKKCGVLLSEQTQPVGQVRLFTNVGLTLASQCLPSTVIRALLLSTLH